MLAKVINGSRVFVKYTNVHKVSSKPSMILVFIFAVLGCSAGRFLRCQSRPSKMRNFSETNWL